MAPKLPRTRGGRRKSLLLVLYLSWSGGFKPALKNSKLLLLHQQHRESVSLDAGTVFDLGNIGKFGGHFVQDFLSALFTGHLATNKHQGCLDAVAFLDEPPRRINFRLKVMLIDIGAKANLFDLDNMLFFAIVLVLFGQFVAVLAVVNNFTDGWSRGRCDFHKVEAGDFCRLKRFQIGDYSDLFAVGADKTDLWRDDLVIDAGIFGKIPRGACLVRVNGYTPDV